MRILDVTLPLSEDLPTWPGEPGVELTLIKSMERDGVNVSVLRCGLHTGTHVDAPWHFVEGGARADSMSLKHLVGPVQLVSLPQAAEIGRVELESAGLDEGIVRVLFQTRNSELWAAGEREFRKDFVALTPEGAEWIVERGIQVVGVDYLSVQRFSDPEPVTHRTLLKAEVAVIEGLNLAGVLPGRYTLVCLPLRLAADGAPARVLLLDEGAIA